MIPTVFRFNREVVGHTPAGSHPSPLATPEKLWLVGALHEEVQEFLDAKTLVDRVDALIDTSIFAIGGLYRMGFSESQAASCFYRIGVTSLPDSPSIIDAAFAFYRKMFGSHPAGDLGDISPEAIGSLARVIRAQTGELEKAESVEAQFRAVADAAIHAIGGLFLLGLYEEQAMQCFVDVMEANMTKKAGQKPGREVEGVKDAIKPAGWVAPEARIAATLGVSL